MTIRDTSNLNFFPMGFETFTKKGRNMQTFTNIFVFVIIIVATITIAWALAPILKSDNKK